QVWRLARTAKQLRPNAHWPGLARPAENPNITRSADGRDRTIPLFCSPPMTEAEPRRVLFLCSGNYYRSRFAELFFNHLPAAEGLSYRADSAGLWPECH